MNLRTVAFLFLLAAPVAAQEDLQNPEYLGKVVRTLAAQNRAGAIYDFLHNEFPEFSSMLDRAGLAEFLDGRKSADAFESAWRARKGEGRLPSSVIDSLYQAFRYALRVKPETPPSSADSAAARVSGRSVERILSQMYNAPRHPLASWSEMRSVRMVQIEGELVWFNPDVAIPELDIKPGVPLTRSQKEHVAKLFSVRVIDEAPGQPVVGTASYPSDVGRSVTLVPKSLTIIDGNTGDVQGEIMLKGSGLNPPTAKQSLLSGESALGELVIDEGLVDALVGHGLGRAGARTYVPIAVIRVAERPGMPAKGSPRVIEVRAAETTLRIMPHVTDTPTKEAAFLLDYAAQEAGLNERGTPFTRREWAQTYLPRHLGLSVGVMAELGVRHSDHGGNVGPGQLVDFGEAGLFTGRGGATGVYGHRRDLESVLAVVDRTLPAEQWIDRKEALRIYDEAVEEGRDIVRRRGAEVRIPEQYVELLDATELRYLLAGYREWISGLTNLPKNREILEVEAVKWGIGAGTGEKPSFSQMQEEILKRYDALSPPERKGEVPELRRILEILGGVEDTALTGQLMEVTLEELRDRARALGVDAPERMNAAQLLRAIKERSGGAQSRAVSSLRRAGVEQVKGGALFAGAFALKGIVTRDVEELRQLAEAGFWGSVALFGVASQVAQTVMAAVAKRVPAGAAQTVPKAAVRAASLGQVGLHMAAGMAAVQVATTGQISLNDLALSTASYVIAGAAVNLVADAAMLAVLGATPAGWVYVVAKLALMLCLGEQLEGWLRAWSAGARERVVAAIAGVKRKIEAIRP